MKFLTAREAAAQLRVTRKHLRDLIAQGVLPARRRGLRGRLLIQSRVLEQLLKPVAKNGQEKGDFSLHATEKRIDLPQKASLCLPRGYAHNPGGTQAWTPCNRACAWNGSRAPRRPCLA